MIEKNNRIDINFIPIIEEFLFRVADQCNWTQLELDNAISKLERVDSINFANLWKKENILLLFNIKTKPCDAYALRNNITKELSIVFDIDDLKKILQFDRSGIELFINNSFHELGHIIQETKKEEPYLYDRKYDKWGTGFEIDLIDPETQIVEQNKDVMMTEFAEVINACRLQNGNIKTDQYIGYKNMHNVGRVVLSSLGISELEFADLQYKINPREAYEHCIDSKLAGLQANLYRDSFGEVFDAISNFSSDKKQRKNFIAQIDSLQILSESLFNERFNYILQNSDNILKNLAKLKIDIDRKNNALKMIFDEFYIRGSELAINLGTDIKSELLHQGFGYEFIKKLYDTEINEKLEIQRDMDNRNRNYNNDEFIEKIYQHFLNYKVKNIPLTDKNEIIINKILGLIKRQFNKNTNSLPAVASCSYTAHRKFASRLSDLDKYKGNDTLNVHNTVQKRKESRGNNENTR